MSEQVRYESAERVRDFYRNQGAAKEQQRILDLLYSEYHKMLDAGHKAHVAGLDYAITVLKGETK
jgi:hypothetical protein